MDKKESNQTLASETEQIYKPLEKRMGRRMSAATYFLAASLLVHTIGPAIATKVRDVLEQKDPQNPEKNPLEELLHLRNPDQKALEKLKTKLKKNLEQQEHISYEFFRMEGEKAGMGMTESEELEAKNVIAADVEELEKIQPIDPTPEFLAEVEKRADNSGNRHTLIRASTIRFAVRKGLNKDLLGSCKAKSGYVAILLEKLYPMRSDDILFQKLGEHIRTLFKIPETGKTYAIEPGIPEVTPENSDGTGIFGIREDIAAFVGGEMTPTITVENEEKAVKESAAGNPFYQSPPAIHTDNIFPSPSIKGPLRLYNPDTAEFKRKYEEQMRQLTKNLKSEEREIKERQNVSIVEPIDLTVYNYETLRKLEYPFARTYPLELLLVKYNLEVSPATIRKLNHFETNFEVRKNDIGKPRGIWYPQEVFGTYDENTLKEIWTDPPYEIGFTYWDEEMAISQNFLHAYEHRKQNPFSLSLRLSTFPDSYIRKELFRSLSGIRQLVLDDFIPTNEELDYLSVTDVKYVLLAFDPDSPNISADVLKKISAMTNKYFFVLFRNITPDVLPIVLEASNIIVSDFVPDEERRAADFTPKEMQEAERQEKEIAAYYGREVVEKLKKRAVDLNIMAAMKMDREGYLVGRKQK